MNCLTNRWYFNADIWTLSESLVRGCISRERPNELMSAADRTTGAANRALNSHYLGIQGFSRLPPHFFCDTLVERQ